MLYLECIRIVRIVQNVFKAAMLKGECSMSNIFFNNISVGNGLPGKHGWMFFVATV